MKKSILIGISIATLAAALLAAVALGFGDTSTKLNAFSDAKANEQGTEKATIEATSILLYAGMMACLKDGKLRKYCIIMVKNTGRAGV